MEARRRVAVERGTQAMSASFAGRNEERDRDRSSEGEAGVCVGFSFTLRDVLVIHDNRE